MLEKKCARDGTYVQVHLEGRLESGEEVVNRDIGLTLGRGHVYRCFEEAVHGLHVGESRTVKMRVPSQERALISNRATAIGKQNRGEEGMSVALTNGMVAKSRIGPNGTALDCNDQLSGRVMDVTVTLNSMDGRELSSPGSGLLWAVFAGGSFLSLAPILSAISGVSYTRVGYSGGTVCNAEYIDVLRGNTGHFESVAVAYDPLQVSYKELLNVYAAYLEKLDGSRDRGPQYGKAIFCTDDAQFDMACKWRAELNARAGRNLGADLRRIEPREMIVAEDMFQPDL